MLRFQYELFRIWLIQQRVPPLLAHLHCQIYTRIPTLNQKNELIAAFINKTVAIELIHHEGFYIVIYIKLTLLIFEQ